MSKAIQAKPATKALPKVMTETFGTRSILFDPNLPKITISDTRQSAGQYVSCWFSSIEELVGSNAVRRVPDLSGSIWTNVTPVGESKYTMYQYVSALQIQEGTIPTPVTCPAATFTVSVLFANQAVNWTEPGDGVTVVVPKYGVKMSYQVSGWCYMSPVVGSHNLRINYAWSCAGLNQSATSTGTDTTVSTATIDQDTIFGTSCAIRFLKHAMIDGSSSAVTLNKETASDKKSGTVQILCPPATSTTVYDPLIELADWPMIGMLTSDSGLAWWVIFLIVIACIVVTAAIVGSIMYYRKVKYGYYLTKNGTDTLGRPTPVLVEGQTHVNDKKVLSPAVPPVDATRSHLNRFHPMGSAGAGARAQPVRPTHTLSWRTIRA